MKRIPVAFCFDDNMWMLFGVAITSLLYHSVGKCSYDIYCVVPDTFCESKRHELEMLIANKDKNSTITFLNANHDFDKSNTKQYSVGIYYRFMLVKLLPNIDKIIYTDVDVVFTDSLIDLFNIDLKKNLIAGISDATQNRMWPSNKNAYVNSGVLVINLSEIRKLNMYKQWLKLSMDDCFDYPDQDILNKTCDGKITYLPMRYNYMPGDGNRLQCAVNSGVYAQSDYDNARHNPCIIHYILRQPWKNRENIDGPNWWKYCYMTPFYAWFYNNINHELNLIKKDILLFNCIKLITIKVRQHKIKYYLFGFIPLFLVKIPDRFA